MKSLKWGEVGCNDYIWMNLVEIMRKLHEFPAIYDSVITQYLHDYSIILLCETWNQI